MYLLFFALCVDAVGIFNVLWVSTHTHMRTDSCSSNCFDKLRTSHIPI